MDKQTALQILKKFKQDKGKVYSLNSLGMFGSIARNEGKEESDIDVVYETSNPNLLRTVHMKEELESLFHSRVDVVRYRPQMNHHLKKHIEEEAVYV